MNHAPASRAERLTGWLSLVAVAAVLLTCVLLAGGCTTAKPTPPTTASTWPVVKDSIAPTLIRPGLFPSKQQVADSQAEYHQRPVSSHAKPGILSGIGRLFSTPAGIERRQAVRLARASVPRKLAKGAVYAPQATQVAVGYKNRAAVVLADSGATVTAIGKVKAPVASATGATATQTNPTTGISWWWLLIPAAYVAFRVYRSTIPFA